MKNINKMFALSLIALFVFSVAVYADNGSITTQDNNTIEAKNIRCSAGQIIGDLNDDGQITASDRVILQNIVSGYWFVQGDVCCADLNQDGHIAVADLVYMNNIFAGTSESPGVCPSSSDGGGSGSNAQVKISVIPEIQKARPGEFAEYKILVKDLHKSVCGSNEGVVCEAMPIRLYDYTISVSGDNIEAEYETDISVLQGSQKEISLRVQGKEKGTYKFEVKVSEKDNSENKAIDKAVLLVIPEKNPEKPKKVVFNGDGFIINNDETKGEYIKLSLLQRELKQGEVSIPEAIPIIGKASIGIPAENYKIKGHLDLLGNLEIEFYRINVYGEQSNEKELSVSRSSITDSESSITEAEIEKEISEIENSETSKAPDYTFIGTLKTYGEIKIVKGNLISFDNKEWSLTAFSRVKSEVRESISVEDKARVVSGISTSEVIPLRKEKQAEEETNVYVQPIRVYRPKILYIIPNPFARKIVEARVVSENEIRVVNIREGRTQEVDGYKIKASSLKDEKNIELEISR